MAEPSFQTAMTLNAVIAITRPQIALQAVAYTVLGAYLSRPTTVEFDAGLFPALIGVALVVSFGFVVNDDADYAIDRLSKPERPLVAGLLSRRHARVIALVLAALVCCVLPWSSLPVALLLLINLCVTLLYALRLKRTLLLGNLSIAYLNASILCFGALAAHGLSLLVWLVAAMSFTYTLAQEILYTIDDYAGDAASGIVTTAIAFGIEPSLWLVRGLLLAATVLAVAPWWFGLTSTPYLVMLIVCTLAPIVLRILPLLRRGDPERIRRACRIVKWVRLSSLLPLLLIAL